jgi:hypothetical protein
VKQLMGFAAFASAVYFARRFIKQAVGDKIFWWLLFAVVLAAGISGGSRRAIRQEQNFSERCVRHRDRIALRCHVAADASADRLEAIPEVHLPARGNPESPWSNSRPPGVATASRWRPASSTRAACGDDQAA